MIATFGPIPLQNKTTDTCQGDRGGPLVVQKSTKDNSAVIYGISTLNGDGCASVKTPGKYTRVSKFLPWIKESVIGRDYLTLLCYFCSN